MSEVPLSPVGREQIHRLEAALLIGSILRPDVLEELRNAEERLTWVDSLAVAAAALAREKAKMAVSQIADEIGRSESTIRVHLQGRTKAGQIVKETYERFSKEGVDVKLPEIFPQKVATLDRSKLEEEVKELRSKLEDERKKFEEFRERVKSLAEDMSRLLEELRRSVEF